MGKPEQNNETTRPAQATGSASTTATEPSNQQKVRKRYRTDRHSIDRKRLPLPFKVFGVLCLVAGAASAALMTLTIVLMAIAVVGGEYDLGASTATLTIFIINLILYLILAVLFAVFGIRLLRNKRKHAAQGTEAMIFLLAGDIICSIMLNGLGASVIPDAVIAVFLIVMQSYLDPALAGERDLQRKLRDMETREQAEEGTLGLDPTGKGYITLNFFNLFWIFVVASVLGLLMEEIVHFLFVVPGQWQDRAGLLFGPFSPIYGCGAVLMTIFLNRFHKSNWLVIFLVAAVIGGAFEAFVSLFMQYAFGAVAWDYSNMPGSLFGGRTCLPFMACWGLLGVVWIKLLLPFMLRLVNFIPWNWRYMLTTVAACFMLVDAVMTLQALDCWYMRLSHDPIDTPIQQFYDHEFGDTYMADRFQSMTIVPSDAVRG